MKSQPLPVTRVTLYTAGVGLFEHQDEVDGPVSVAFRLEESQLRDVLKSLVVQDPGDKASIRISYPTREPREKTLESFAVRLNGPATMEEILQSLAGAEVEVGLQPPVSGRLLGIDKEANEETERHPRTLVHLQTDAGLVRLVLPEGVGVKLKDERLRADLDRALRFLFQSLDENRTTLEAEYEAAGKRTIRASYVTGAPVWKTSYRLDLNRDKPRLEGWAIVENPTDSDWEGIQLNLVSGRPVSFIQDLATPRWIRRHEVAVQDEQAPPPVVAAEAMPPPAPAPMVERMRSGSMAKKARAEKEEAFFGMAAEGAPTMSMDESPAPVAEGAKAGNLIRFTLKEPVYLPRRKSAVLPILGGNIEGEKILYRPLNWREPHPLAGVRLTNSLGLRLPPGPVTVYDSGVFAGDALTDGIGEGDKRLLTYAQDVTVLTEAATTNVTQIQGYRAQKGYLYTKVQRIWTTVYSAENKSDEEKLLVVEHTKDLGKVLNEPAKPAETTLVAYRFELKIQPQSKGELKVVESRVEEESLSLFSQTAASITTFSKAGGLKDAAKAAFQSLAAQKAEIDALEEKIERLETEREQIGALQERYRKNLDSAGRDSAEGRTFLKKLMDSETQWEEKGRQLEELESLLAHKNKAFEEAVQELSFEIAL